MIAKITQDDIDEAPQRKGRECPLARAIAREMEDYCYVGNTYIYANKSPGVEFDCDPKVRQWIRDFDEGNKVEPFGLLLDQNLKKAIYMEEDSAQNGQATHHQRCD